MSRSANVCLVASFEQNIHFEMALTLLEQKGVGREQIFAVPLETSPGEPQLFDTIQRSDGRSMFDGAAALGTAMMVLGSIYGFIWEWGPVIWGIIGLFGGGLIGFGLDYFWTERRHKQQRNTHKTEVFVLLYCCPDEVKDIEYMLWQQGANGVARLNRSAHSEK